MKSKIKTNSGKIFSARKTSIFFAILFILVLAISYSCKNNSTGSGGGDIQIRNFEMTMRSSGNVTNLVRSQISSNDNNKAGTNNSQDLKVFFEANGNYTTVVQATYLGTNYSGGSYDPSTGVITLTDITNWTNTQGAPLFDTNPRNFTVKITATASGFDTGSPKEFTIPASLQFSTLIPSSDITNIFTNTINGKGNPVTNVNTANGDPIEYKWNNDQYSFGEGELNLTNNQAKAFTITNSSFVTNLYLLTNQNDFSKYFANLSLTYDGSTNKNMHTFIANFTPHYSNEMTNANSYKINFWSKNDYEISYNENE